MRRSEEAELSAQEVQRRFEESERLHAESQRQTDEKAKSYESRDAKLYCTSSRSTMNIMNALQSTPPTNSTPLTEDQIYDKVLGKRHGYVHNLGHGQDSLPSYDLDELDNVEATRRNAHKAEKQAEKAERRAEEA